MRFFLPRAKEVLKRLCLLTEQQGTLLVHYIDSPSAQRPPKKQIADQLGLSEDAFLDVLEYAKAIRSFNESDLTNHAILGQEIDRINKDFGLTLKLDHAIKLLSLMIPQSSKQKQERKRRRIQGGMGNKLEGVGSLVDLRPVFTVDRTSIESWVIGTTLRIEYETPEGEEQVLLLEIDDTSLEELNEALKVVRNKKDEVVKSAEAAKLI
ncbi:MAG TPA: hypothetical protein VJ044_02365 [Candidatus Hodarchaeales archaeon]|nr:hypothetical protein [Candidatus Hodarchaeales archaeon]